MRASWLSLGVVVLLSGCDAVIGDSDGGSGGGAATGGGTTGGSGGGATGGGATGGGATGGGSATGGGATGGGSATGGGTATGGGATGGGGGSATGGGATGGGGGGTGNTVTVTLTRASGITGTQRVNVGVPTSDGATMPSTPVTVLISGTPTATSSRALATFPSGSVRSWQIQFDAPMTATTAEIQFGTAPPMALTAQTVDSLQQDEALGSAMVRTPRVWATLPATWLVASGVAGHFIPNAQLTTAPMNAWRTQCNYASYGSTAFASGIATAGSWLYDRGTAFFRGYVVTGNVSELQVAWRETDLYRQRLLMSSTVPPSSDLKYNYTQNLALHYLLSGDDRFREAAETIAGRNPVSGYTGALGGGFWTERHAGFGLLANVWAARVSDDQASTFRARAETIVTNLIAIQDTALNLSSAPANKNLDASYRCFPHTPAAHDPSEYVNLDSAMQATLVCSPWMSAITADGLEAFADDANPTRRAEALNSIVRLGRRLGNPDNRNVSGGRPHYLLGVDGANAQDDFDEHWGEVAYVAAMAFFYSGRTDNTLRANAMHYVNGFANDGTIGQLRSFNWQCRSAIATPFYLQ